MVEKELPIISCEFSNLILLQNALMTFVRDGAVFIPTDQDFHLGDKVKAVVSLPNEDQQFTFTGEVIWITPKSVHSARHHPGVGVQCNDADGEAFLKQALHLLADQKDEAIESETM